MLTESRNISRGKPPGDLFVSIDVIVEINSKAFVRLLSFFSDMIDWVFFFLIRSEARRFGNDCTTKSIKVNQFQLLLQIQAPFQLED